MTKIIQFIPKQNLDAQKNLLDFIHRCKSDLTVFSADLDWNYNHWQEAGVTFGNLDQKSRILNEQNVMKKPFLDFAKAYLRYQQGHKPTKTKQELPALKCLERALISSFKRADISDLNIAVLDMAATVARNHLSSGQAYHIGRELERLGKFVSEMHLIPNWLDWKNPNKRPIDSVRTGEKARELREKRLPNEEALNAIADIFSNSPTSPKDIFTTSVCAMLLCAPSRVSEILTLPVDCEVWETKRDGKKAYGWRFQPGKGGLPCIKWIPESMETLAQNAIQRIRKLTDEARNIAKWYETTPHLFYRHKNCPNVDENQSLTIIDAGQAIGIVLEHAQQYRNEFKQFDISSYEYNKNTLSKLNSWVLSKLPEDFPWYDKGRNLRYSEALFSLQAKQLRPDMPPSPVIIWKPTANTLNDDLSSVLKQKDYIKPSIFDRNGFNDGMNTALKMTSHQFRHLLNTMAQRGGLSQSEIARWSGRADMKQNRIYDHMTEFELVAMIRNSDDSLSLDCPLTEIAEQISTKLPISRSEFNSVAIPTAHITEFGFCIHDFAMSPCQRFRDCLNCTEQVCVKGDRRIDRIKKRYQDIKRLKEHAEQAMQEGTAGADRWYEIHSLTETRTKELIEILENPKIPDGAIVKLKNKNEFSPLRRAVESRIGKKNNDTKEKIMLNEMRNLLGGGLG